MVRFFQSSDGPSETALGRRGLLRCQRTGENENRLRRRRQELRCLSRHNHLRPRSNASFVLRHHRAAGSSRVLRSPSFGSPCCFELSLGSACACRENSGVTDSRRFRRPITSCTGKELGITMACPGHRRLILDTEFLEIGSPNGKCAIRRSLNRGGVNPIELCHKRAIRFEPICANTSFFDT